MLQVEGIRKVFKDRVAVDGLSFEVRRGEIFGFLGPNGAGKTTSLRMILGITRPDAGTVRFEASPGAEPAALDRRRIGYLPEERGLFEDQKVLDVLGYLGELRGLSPADARRKSAAWLERLGLADRAKAKVNELSKGMQQKIQFAGAVLHDPALAVLDEPFSGLDPLNQELFLQIVRELRDRGTTVLLSAHQLNLVERLCDRFLLIARGRAVLTGRLDEMRREATGGATETLRLELGARETAPNEASVRPILAASGLDGALRFERRNTTGLFVEISLPSSTDLGPALAALGRSFAVLRVETTPISLHEIYLRAVRSTLGEQAIEEEFRD
ncbi:MAG: ABC transporter ATP-binding protein [Candidatus Eiseniibacteriota bacterium]